MNFSADQESAIDRILAMRTGVHFLTGNAGAGKSTVIREIRSRRTSVMLAPTGLAALNVGGMTIHKFFGFGIGPKMKSNCHGLDERWEYAFKRGALLIIDEASMVRVDLMDAVNWSLQKTMRSSEPFGGVPVVLVGDMMQLEPVLVTGGDEEKFITSRYKSTFWFDAQAFTGKDSLFDGEALQPEIIHLTQIHRQANPDLIQALNLIRIGSEEGLEYLNQRAMIEPAEEAVTLTFGNKEADATNARKLMALPGSRTVIEDGEVMGGPMRFEAEISEGFVRGKDDRDCPAPPVLELSVGARVMCVKNTEGENGYVANGSTGTVKAFYRNRPVVELDSGELWVVDSALWEQKGFSYDPADEKLTEDVTGTFRQVPLKLAWASTTHKAQGQTLSAAHLALEMKAFAHGQLYVALSRVQTLEGLTMQRRLNPKDIVINKRVLEFLGLVEPTPKLTMEAFAQ